MGLLYWECFVVRGDGVVRDLKNWFEGHCRGGIDHDIQSLFLGELLHHVRHARAYALKNILTVAVNIRLEVIAQPLRLALFALAASLQIGLTRGAQLALTGLKLGLDV